MLRTAGQSVFANHALVARPDFHPEKSLMALAASSIGLAVCDKRLRYVALNRTIARYHRVRPEEHLRRPLHDILGSLAEAIAPKIEQVFATGSPVLNFENRGSLPRRRRLCCWTADYIPLTDGSRKVEYVCAVVTETTDHKTIQSELENLREEALGKLAASMQQTQLLLEDLISLGATNLAASPDQILGLVKERLREYRRILSRTAASIYSAQRKDESDAVTRKLHSLPPRERDILRLLVSRRSLKQVTALLGLRPETVERQIATLLSKLEIDSIDSLIAFATKNMFRL